MTLVVVGPPGGDGSLEGVSPTHPLAQLSLLPEPLRCEKVAQQNSCYSDCSRSHASPHQGGLKVSDVMSPDTAFLHEADSVKCSIPEMRKVSERICIVFIWILDITFFSFKSCTGYLTVQSNFRAGKMAQLVKVLALKV